MIQVLYPKWNEYELLDSGDFKKLERIGKYTIVRDDPKAWWQKSNPKAWEKCDARFFEGDKKGWEFKKELPNEWYVSLKNLKFKIALENKSKQIGIFPEQYCHWVWIDERIRASKKPLKLLNLFGYTGIASVVASNAGANVTHVDALKSCINWGKTNVSLSSIENNIRWIIDDCLKFVQKEAKRGQKYDAIIMDPPAFGRGANNEIWKIEQHFKELIKTCGEILSDNPNFIIVNMYSLEQSSITIANFLSETMKNYQGDIEIGELAIKQKNSNIVLPMSLYGKWVSKSN